MLLFCVFLLMEGVFSETVKEGDSVTLFPQLAEIKPDDVIDWRFGDNLIARVRNNNNPTVYEDALEGKFKGRLKLDGQTGNLTIKNTLTTDAGVYEVSNSINTIKKTFNVSVIVRVNPSVNSSVNPSVNPSVNSSVNPSVNSSVNSSVIGIFGETVSVKEGKPAILLPELEIKSDDVIDWRFGDILIARVRNNNNPTVYEDALEGKFKGRLNLDGRTGDLTIKNTKKADTGVYEVSNQINTIKKTFRVTVSSGLSAGVIAGIVVGVVLVLVVAVVGGWFLYKKKSDMI